MIRLLLVVLMFPASLHAESPPNVDMFLGCEHDSQCRVLESACADSWYAVNTDFEQWSIRHRDIERASVECAKPAHTPPKPRVVCVNQRCTIAD